jgi:hypothetical protein
MQTLNELLDEFYPTDTEISHIQRQAFKDGYCAAYTEMARKTPEVMQNPFITSIDVIPTEDLYKSLDTIERLQREFKPLKP